MPIYIDIIVIKHNSILICIKKWGQTFRLQNHKDDMADGLYWYWCWYFILFIVLWWNLPETIKFESFLGTHLSFDSVERQLWQAKLHKLNTGYWYLLRICMAESMAMGAIFLCNFPWYRIVMWYRTVMCSLLWNRIVMCSPLCFLEIGYHFWISCKLDHCRKESQVCFFMQTTPYHMI